MHRATIIFHQPPHRRACLQQEGDTATSRAAYDGNIGRYVEFLNTAGSRHGFDVRMDHQNVDPMFTIDERDHAAKKAAHAYVQKLPDFWEWLT